MESVIILHSIRHARLKSLRLDIMLGLLGANMELLLELSHLGLFLSGRVVAAAAEIGG